MPGAQLIELLLLRHAKSSRDDEGLADHARPLSKLGKGAARDMGRYMAKAGLTPDTVLCSTARRARETWDLVASELPGGIRTEVLDALYDFGDGTRLIDVIRMRGDTSRRLMLVGHNPSLEQLARRLTGSGEPQLRARLSAKYPTAALALLRFDAMDWADIAEASGHLVAFVRPRDLQASHGA